MPHPIQEVAQRLGLSSEDLIPYGRDKAKIATPLSTRSTRDGKLILISAMTPTRAGEGKTSVAIGLADALADRGRSVCVALREPSMGPCMGIKGGGTGGGLSHLHPSDDINLHFTGDFHAITSGHNLLSAAIDNHLHFGHDLGIEASRIEWPRVLDVSDRALRHVVTGLGGPAHGVPHETGFEITAASELMAILCLAEDVEDLRRRIDRIVIGFSRQGQPVLAEKLGVTGAILALLRDAIHPNLVQTRFGTPALVHGGPFANIAHGCSSVVATRTALKTSDWVVTEAGFGSDLGAEKFFDIKCRGADLEPAAVVLVATVRALKLHGGRRMETLAVPDPDGVVEGLPNLAQHVHNVHRFSKPLVVAVNRFDTDAPEEIAVVKTWCDEQGLPMVVTDSYLEGPSGAHALAEAVEELASTPAPRFVPLYRFEDSLRDKVEAVAKAMYGATSVTYTAGAERAMKVLDGAGYGELPICVAKTQASLSDEASAKGRPRDFAIKVRDLRVSAGAGFVVVLTRDILRMPGLPRAPQAGAIDLVEGEIVGLR